MDVPQPVAAPFAQFGPSQLAIMTVEGTQFVDQRLVIRYLIAPRQRPAKHR